MRSVIQIQEQLSEVIASISKTLTAQEYSLNTGQTEQKVKRANLNDLRNLQYSLESELSVALKKQNGLQIFKGRIGC